MSAKSTTQVFLWYPNLIGYARVFCMAASIHYLLENNAECFFWFYLAAFAGDLVDGWVARKFNQTSKFGGVLDMVTDRVSTAALAMAILPDLPYANFFWPFCKKSCIFFVVLDIASHWFHVQSVSAHHKSKEALTHRSALLQWYYSIYPLFAYCCVAAELFWVLLALIIKGTTFDLGDKVSFLKFAKYPLTMFNFWKYICGPGFLIKHIINVVQMFDACNALASLDVDVEGSADSSSSVVPVAKKASTQEAVPQRARTPRGKEKKRSD